VQILSYSSSSLPRWQRFRRLPRIEASKEDPMLPPLLSNLLEPGTQSPRSRLFWAVLGALAVGQLLAFWLLCSHQVRKAEVRKTAVMVQQMALADCLQYIPGSTIASCSSHLDAARSSDTRVMGGGAQRGAGNSPMAGATPVGFSYR